jgi:hypothetical protein
MNSLPDNRLEETIDQLLASSVSPGSEPEGFRIVPMPSRPEFPWMYLVYALAGLSLFGFFLVQWLLAQPLEEINYIHLFSVDGITALFSGLSSGTLATLFGLAAAAALMAPEKLKLLYRTL